MRRHHLVRRGPRQPKGMMMMEVERREKGKREKEKRKNKPILCESTCACNYVTYKIIIVMVSQHISVHLTAIITVCFTT